MQPPRAMDAEEIKGMHNRLVAEAAGIVRRMEGDGAIGEFAEWLATSLPGKLGEDAENHEIAEFVEGLVDGLTKLPECARMRKRKIGGSL